MPRWWGSCRLSGYFDFLCLCKSTHQKHSAVRQPTARADKCATTTRKRSAKSQAAALKNIQRSDNQRHVRTNAQHSETLSDPSSGRTQEHSVVRQSKARTDKCVTTTRKRPAIRQAAALKNIRWSDNQRHVRTNTQPKLGIAQRSDCAGYNRWSQTPSSRAHQRRRPHQLRHINDRRTSNGACSHK